MFERKSTTFKELESMIGRLNHVTHNNKIYETPTTFQEKLDISENKKHQNDKN